MKVEFLSAKDKFSPTLPDRWAYRTVTIGTVCLPPSIRPNVVAHRCCFISFIASPVESLAEV